MKHNGSGDPLIIMLIWFIYSTFIDFLLWESIYTQFLEDYKDCESCLFLSDKISEWFKQLNK